MTASSSRSSPRASARAQSGADAETLAARFLEARGLRVLTRNFRARRGEIDLVARDGDTLVFVEVRLRRSETFGGAVESITPQKRARLVAAAQAYLLGLRSEPPCRFDAILLDRLDPTRVDWRRNVIEGP